VELPLGQAGKIGWPSPKRTSRKVRSGSLEGKGLTSRITRLVAGALPVGILGLFAWYVRHECCAYMRSDGSYTLSSMSVLPEDVLGLGPWPMWIIAIAALLITCAFAFRLATRSRWYFAVVGLAFAALVATDWHFYRGLEQAVLGR
jgi:hypothetical protein